MDDIEGSYSWRSTFGSSDEDITLRAGRFWMSNTWESGGEMGGSRTEGSYVVKGDEVVLRADSEYGWEQSGGGRGHEGTEGSRWVGYARIIREEVKDGLPAALGEGRPPGIYLTLALLDGPGGEVRKYLKKNEG